MKFKIALMCVIVVFIACNSSDKAGHAQREGHSNSGDTTVGSKVMTDEVAGSAYRKRGKGFFIIVDKDTSDFRCFVEESKEGGRVAMSIRYEEEGKKPYDQRMIELKKILPIVAIDFNLDSLNDVYFGRLVYSGDLAILLTNEYRTVYGQVNNRTLSQFLNDSKLSSDFNDLFKPYSLAVKGISCEKSHFSSREELLKVSKVKADSSRIPNKIVDCMAWIGMKRR